MYCKPKKEKWLTLGTDVQVITKSNDSIGKPKKPHPYFEASWNLVRLRKTAKTMKLMKPVHLHVVMTRLKYVHCNIV